MNEAAIEVFLPGCQSDLTDPRVIGLAWFVAVATDHRMAQYLVSNPDNWDFAHVRAVIHKDDLALEPEVMPSEDCPALMGHMRLVGSAADSRRASGETRGSARIVTLVRRPDGTWRVWSLTVRYPKASDVFF